METFEEEVEAELEADELVELGELDVVEFEEHPARSIAATATPETPVATFFKAVFFILIPPIYNLFSNITPSDESFFEFRNSPVRN